MNSITHTVNSLRQTAFSTILFISYFVICNSLFSQNIGINPYGNLPDPSAALDIDFKNKGLLIPRMTTAQRNSINGGVIAQSLLIYNTELNCLQIYFGTAWENVFCSATCSVPSTPNAIAGNTTLCENDTGISYSIAIVSGATSYNWTVPAGATITSGQGTTSIVVTFTTTSGNITVVASNSCGNSTAQTLAVSTSSCGFPPCTYNNSNSFTDARDGKNYSQVQIGTQCWMAENLNYGSYVAIHGGTQTSGEKYCTNLSGVNDSTCPFGGLYEWANMMNGAASCNGTGAGQPSCTTPVQGLCPSGWHIPSHYEWTLLEKNSGSNPGAFPYDETTGGFGTAASLGTDEGGNLKQAGTTNWTTPNTGATNSTGFTALPSAESGFGSFGMVGYFGEFWSSTERSSDNTLAWQRYFVYNSQQVSRHVPYKTWGNSVRCVKD